MGIIGAILLVAFIIICILLILLVLVQNEEGKSGLMGNSASVAFGSHSASVLTKTTRVLVVLFFLTVIGLAVMNKKPAVQSDLSGAAQSVENASGTESTSDAATAGEWWKNSESKESTSDTEPIVEETTETTTAQ